MIRFYFDIFDGEDHLDVDGTDLPDEHVARQEALRFVAALMADTPVSEALGRIWTLVVRRGAEVVLRLEVRV